MLAIAPALPLHTAGKYVAGAYVVLFAIVLIYVAIMAVRLNRIERDLGGLLELADRNRQPSRTGGETGDTTGVGGTGAAATSTGSPEDSARAESTPV
jgi:hypothetical protein